MGLGNAQNLYMICLSVCSNMQLKHFFYVVTFGPRNFDSISNLLSPSKENTWIFPLPFTVILPSMWFKYSFGLYHALFINHKLFNKQHTSGEDRMRCYLSRVAIVDYLYYVSDFNDSFYGMTKMYSNKVSRLNIAVYLMSETEVCLMQIGIDCESCNSGIQTSSMCPLHDLMRLVRTSEDRGWRGQGLGRKILLLLVDICQRSLPINERNSGMQLWLNYNLSSKKERTRVATMGVN